MKFRRLLCLGNLVTDFGLGLLTKALSIQTSSLVQGNFSGGVGLTDILLKVIKLIYKLNEVKYSNNDALYKYGEVHIIATISLPKFIFLHRSVAKLVSYAIKLLSRETNLTRLEPFTRNSLVSCRGKEILLASNQ